MRILKEIYKRAREQFGSTYPIMLKINCQDYLRGEFEFEDCQKVCIEMDRMGINALEVSCGMPDSVFSTIRGGIPEEVVFRNTDVLKRTLFKLLEKRMRKLATDAKSHDHYHIGLKIPTRS